MGLTVADRLILAAVGLSEDGSETFTAEELVVAAWTKFPETFGLRGVLDAQGRPRYPDSNRVFAEIMGRMPVRRRGWLEKVGNKRYRVTRIGRVHADDIEGSAGIKKAALDRVAADEVTRLLGSRAMDKFRSGRDLELTFHDACALWGITPRSNAKELSTRLAGYDDLVNTIDALTLRDDFVLRHGARPYTHDDITMLRDLSSELRTRFDSEIQVIKRRVSER